VIAGTVGRMKARRWGATLVVTLVIAAAAWSPGPAPAGAVELLAEDAVALAVRAQPAVVAAAHRFGDHLSLLAVLVGLVAVTAPIGARFRAASGAPARSAPDRCAVRPRGPPRFAS
jgi:hypothetical protein